MAVKAIVYTRMTGPMERACPPRCSIGVVGIKFDQGQIDQIHAMYEEGLAYTVIRVRLLEWLGPDGYVDPKSLASHMNHLREKVSPGQVLAAARKVNSIDVLESIVAAGFANSARWRPTLSDTMRAVQLLGALRPGGNSAMDELLETIAAAATGTTDDDGEDGDDDFDGDGELGPEAPDALGTPDEQGPGEI